MPAISDSEPSTSLVGRLAPRLEVIRALFARSGNLCAFPGCKQQLVNHKNQLVGQVCHIAGALPGGERYNATQTDEQRRGYDNLILLCYPHHVETNDTAEFSVEILERFKRQHEARVAEVCFVLDEATLSQISADIEVYWEQIARLNTIEHSMVQLRVPIEANASGGCS